MLGASLYPGLVDNAFTAFLASASVEKTPILKQEMRPGAQYLLNSSKNKEMQTYLLYYIKYIRDI